MYFIQYAVCSFHEWLPQTLWWQLQPVRPTWRQNACKCHNARKGSRHRTTLTNLNVIALFVGAVAASSSSTGRHGDLIEAVIILLTGDTTWFALVKGREGRARARGMAVECVFRSILCCMVPVSRLWCRAHGMVTQLREWSKKEGELDSRYRFLAPSHYVLFHQKQKKA